MKEKKKLFILFLGALILITGASRLSFDNLPTLHPQLATDPESALALQFRRPIDTIPADLLEDIPGLSTTIVSGLLAAVSAYCEKKNGDWEWTDIHGVGEKRAEILGQYVTQPICVELY